MSKHFNLLYLFEHVLKFIPFTIYSKIKKFVLNFLETIFFSTKAQFHFKLFDEEEKWWS
jgi:hypothetical protein